jgi:uncharacterized protein
LSDHKMLLLKVSEIPSEGREIDTPLSTADLHLEAEDSFSFLGGHLRCLVEPGEDDAVHVRGPLEAQLRMQCGRCLEPYDHPIRQELDLYYMAHQPESGGPEEEDEVELADHDMVVAYYDRDRLDLGETVREQLLLGVPLKRLCREDCRGLCPTCGQNLNTARCDCPPESPGDPRLSVLGKLFDKGSS